MPAPQEKLNGCVCRRNSTTAELNPVTTSRTPTRIVQASSRMAQDRLVVKRSTWRRRRPRVIFGGRIERRRYTLIRCHRGEDGEGAWRWSRPRLSAPPRPPPHVSLAAAVLRLSRPQSQLRGQRHASRLFPVRATLHNNRYQHIRLPGWAWG